VIATYLKNLSDVELIEVPFSPDGTTDREQFAAALDERVMCAVIGYPNFFGVIEDLSSLQAGCARFGAHLISVTTEPLALGLLKPPGAHGVDIAVGEGQSLGLPMNLGGPAFGFFAAQKKLMRHLPGRLVGETLDSDGRRGFVLTLATREQHIRREKATSNICTSQTLCTTAATIYLALLGKSGFRRIAEVNLGRAHEARARLIGEAGLSSCFAGPFFNEFVLRTRALPRLFESCAAEKIVPGIALSQWYPELADALLVCVTEMNEQEEIDRLVRALAA
jgi:glycine dehydrogenase subunit 1